MTAPTAENIYKITSMSEAYAIGPYLEYSSHLLVTFDVYEVFTFVVTATLDNQLILPVIPIEKEKLVSNVCYYFNQRCPAPDEVRALLWKKYNWYLFTTTPEQFNPDKFPPY